jgi:type VI secretion system protein VasD
VRVGAGGTGQAGRRQLLTQFGLGLAAPLAQPGAFSLRAWATLGSAALVLGGCGGSPVVTAFTGPKVTSIKGTVTAGADLNPSVSQRPSPLLVRVYELRGATAFNKADFVALYQSDQIALAGDMLAREEWVLQPGENRPWQRQLNDQTRFVAIFGAYRDLERAIWRAVAPVLPGQAQQVQIRAEKLAVSIGIQP